MSKNKGKTAEELLQEVLVPEEEQPYRVPENWLWVRLDSIFKQVNEQIDPTGTETYIGLEHLKKGGGIVKRGDSEDLKSKKVVFKEGDVLYGKLRPYLNKHAFVNFNGVASTDILVFRNENGVLSKLLDLYFSLNHVIEYANMNSNGINLPRVSPKVIGNLPFPLPPVNEQVRIADKVEGFLNKINQAKQLIEEAKETFELRRAAILDKGFRGELTKKWREENKEVSAVEINSISSKLKPLTYEELPFEVHGSWNWYKLGEILKITSGGTPSRTNAEYYNGDIPWVKTGEIKWNDIFDCEEKISEDAIKNSSAKLLPENTVLVAMYGQGLTRGRAAILRKISACNQAVCALLPNENVDPKFLFYYFMEGYHRFRKIAQGGNQENLSASLIANFTIPLPPIEEQLAIVSYLDEIFSKENNISALISFESHLDILVNSILNKAFRGDLGTNDISEKISFNELLDHRITRA
ncbi:type I restriction enzyme S subunit [Paenibacillus sp. DS2015]|uniref:restriction endonuclease subunit S n=1 Tax=Paenibacillus sp. DS2015 TaxID=3373917 RepID=UPI003D2099D0